MSLKYDLFLSHNNVDKDWTQYLANCIEQDASGPPLKVFFDEWDIAPGDDIPLALEQALDNSRHIGLVLSPEAVISRWVALERSTAIYRDPNAQAHTLLPLLRKDCELPGILKRLNYIDFRDDRNFDESFKTLINVLRDRKSRRGSRLSKDDLDFREDCALILKHRVLFDRNAFSISCVWELFLDELNQAIKSTIAALNTGSLYDRNNRLLHTFAPRGEYRTNRFRRAFEEIGRYFFELQRLITEFDVFIRRQIPNYDYWPNFYAMVLNLPYADAILQGVEFMDRIDTLRNNVLGVVNALLELAGGKPFPLIELSSVLAREGNGPIMDGLGMLVRQHYTATSSLLTLSSGVSGRWQRSQTERSSQELYGLGISSNSYKGSARVILDQDELVLVQPGEVLVFPDTSYLNALSSSRIGALVTDKLNQPNLIYGDYLGEKQYGIPMVLGTRLSTTCITNGQIVQVDGPSGMVLFGEGIENHELAT